MGITKLSGIKKPPSIKELRKRIYKPSSRTNVTSNGVFRRKLNFQPSSVDSDDLTKNFNILAI